MLSCTASRQVTIFFKARAADIPTPWMFREDLRCFVSRCFYNSKIACSWQVCWWPFWDGENVTLRKWLSDLQLGDEKVTLNHLVKVARFLNMSSKFFISTTSKSKGVSFSFSIPTEKKLRGISRNRNETTDLNPSKQLYPWRQSWWIHTYPPQGSRCLWDLGIRHFRLDQLWGIFGCPIQKECSVTLSV